MESDGSLRYRCELLTGPCHEPDGASPPSVPIPGHNEEPCQIFRQKKLCTGEKHVQTEM